MPFSTDRRPRPLPPETRAAIPIQFMLGWPGRRRHPRFGRCHAPRRASRSRSFWSSTTMAPRFLDTGSSFRICHDRPDPRHVNDRCDVRLPVQTANRPIWMPSSNVTAWGRWPRYHIRRGLRLHFGQINSPRRHPDRHSKATRQRVGFGNRSNGTEKEATFSF